MAYGQRLVLSVALLCSVSSAFAFVRPRSTARGGALRASHATTSRLSMSSPPPIELASSALLFADDGASGGAFGSSNPLQAFQKNHTFLQGILLAIVTRAVIGEIRRRVEKPVMDELGNRVATQLTPETDTVPAGAWAKVASGRAGDHVTKTLSSTKARSSKQHYVYRAY
jgi:hypothetical protein